MTMNTFRSRSSAIKNFSKVQVVFETKTYKKYFVKSLCSDLHVEMGTWVQVVPECKSDQQIAHLTLFQIPF